MNDCIASCGDCCGSCGSCGAAGQYLSLSEAELSLLQRFAQTPFLPVAQSGTGLSPVLLDAPAGDRPQAGLTLMSMQLKGLVRIDYELPLSNFDYARFPEYTTRGSAALTAYGQEVLDLIEFQGIEQ